MRLAADVLRASGSPVVAPTSARDGEEPRIVRVESQNASSANDLPAKAAAVAAELTAKDALKAHLSAELNIDQDDVVSPWHAALASAIAEVLSVPERYAPDQHQLAENYSLEHVTAAWERVYEGAL